MNINNAISYLEKFNNPKLTLGLKNIQALMDALGNPQDNLKIIHIAGTNGKGSVSQFIGNILVAAGYKVGTFTSPYLVKINEQMTINSKEITDEAFSQLVSDLMPIIDQLHEQQIFPSYFEIVTAIAILYFSHQEVDFVLLEVGLGGAYDATNVISASIASVITKISIDHTDYLGNTLESIATEKAGIIKKTGLVISPVQQPKVNEILKKRCIDMGASLNFARTDHIKILSCDEDGTFFELDGMKYQTKLIGEHQAYNCCIALKVIECLQERSVVSISPQQILQGIYTARWAGRIEKISNNPSFFIDGAHNVDGVTALKNALKNIKSTYKIAVIGILADKEVDKILKIICDEFNEVIVTKPDNPRSLDVDILADKVKAYVPRVHCEEDVEKATQKAMDIANTKINSCVVAFGSLYMIGAVRHYLLKK